MANEEPTREDYRNEIQMMADSVEEGVREYDQNVHEAMHETVDGSQWVIYTNMTIKALYYADSEPDEWKHMVADGDSWQEVVQALAYKMMEGDVYEELRRRDVLDELHDRNQ